MKKVYPARLSFNDCPLKMYITGVGLVAFHPYYRVTEYFPPGVHKPIIKVDGVLFDPSVDYTVYHPLEQSFNFDYE